MKKNKKEKTRLIFITFTFLTLALILVVGSYNDWKEILDNNAKIAFLEDEYEFLIENEKSLLSESTKLKDPEYVARYAKEKYYYSTEDEVIIRFYLDKETE